jgi:tungstate transport system ATP-binding protein
MGEYRGGETSPSGAGSILPLALEDVSFVAGGRTIIDRVSIALAAGPRTVILGPNGAGKSVLMRLCHGLLHPSAGRITWANREQAGERRRQAMVFQRPVMLRRSAAANIAYALELAGVSRAEREREVDAALEGVGLAALAGSAARKLSGGEQQRLALARAWALKPEVLFLDEPTANLDPGAMAEVERIIAAIHAAGTKIVMTTHNLGQARRLGDEILFLHQGRLVERALVERFFVQPASAEAQAFIRGELPWH